MRSRYAARRGCCVLVGLCTAFLAACAGLPSTGPGSNTAPATPTAVPVFAAPTHTPTRVFGVPPSVAAFCPSPQTLAPIVGETMSLDSTTTSSTQATTDCLYHGSTGDQSGDLCAVSLSAWADAQSANSDYTTTMNSIVQMGGPVQNVTGVGDAAYFLATNDGWLTVLKGSDDFTDKCFFLHGQQLVNEQVDIQFAQLLVSRI